MRTPILILSALCVLLLASCGQQAEKQFEIDGHIANMPPQTILLEEVSFENARLIDSVRSDEAGNFVLSGRYSEPALYKIQLGDEYILAVIDTQKIVIRGDWRKIKDYSVTGSPGSSNLQLFLQNYAKLNKQLIASKMAYDSLRRRHMPDSILAAIEIRSDQQYEELISYIKAFSDTTKSSPAAVFAGSKLLGTPEEIDYLKNLSTGLHQRFASTALIQGFNSQVAAKVEQLEGEGAGPKIGSMAPDFTLTSLDGEQVSLSSFRGKYVLLDFWASWCPPCRAENPNVVAAYNSFKDNNFTIVGVSLDSKKEPWQQAVVEDHLNWTQVSDLKGWNSEVAALYGVQSIPTNFLISPEGKIVAMNLRGSRLQRTLKEKLTPQEASEQANAQPQP